jgi:hypothetical protein
MPRITSKAVAATAAAVLTAGVLAGTAMATSGRASPSTFYGCMKNTTKAISSISGSPGLSCASGTTKVSWSAGGGASFAGLYGTGISGNFTLTGMATIGVDRYYNNLTLNSGAVLDTNGYRLFVSGTLTLVGNAIIENNGGAATPGGGPGAPSGTVGGGQIGCFVTCAGAWGNALGGSGGTGSETGVSPATAPTPAAGGPVVFQNAETAVTGHGPDGAVVNGGAGGGDDCNGGGGGGGVVIVVAQKVVHTGSGTAQIQAKGGSGVEGGCGGGGGGGGVVVVVTSSSIPSGVTLNVAGGLGEASNPGSAGTSEWI